MIYRFRIWVKINNTQTTQIYMQGSSSLEVQALCEAQYGTGNVLAVYHDD